MFGLGPVDLNQDWNYDAENVNYDPYSGVTDSINQLQSTNNTMMDRSNQMNAYGQGFMSKSNETYKMGKDFMDPSGSFVTQSQNLFREDLSVSEADKQRNQQSVLAQQGIGGGISKLLGNSGNVGSQLRQSRLGFQNQGMQTGLGLMGASSNFGNNASQMFGQGSAYAGMGLDAQKTAAGMNQNIDSNMLNTSLANAQMNNSATQFGIEGDWNTQSYNASRRDSFNNQMLTMGVGIGLAPFTGGASLGMLGANPMGGGSRNNNNQYPANYGSPVGPDWG